MLNDTPLSRSQAPSIWIEWMVVGPGALERSDRREAGEHQVRPVVGEHPEHRMGVARDAQLPGGVGEDVHVVRARIGDLDRSPERAERGASRRGFPPCQSSKRIDAMS